MSVDVSNSFTGPLYGDGTSTIFPFTFAARSDSEITVSKASSAGIVTIVPSSEYSVSLSDNGGSITFGTAPADDSTTKIYISSDPSFLQQIEFPTGANYDPGSVNEESDRSAIRDIYLKNEISRSIRTNVGEEGLVLPHAELRRGKVLGFDNASGSPSVVDLKKGDPGSPGEGYDTRSALALAGDNATNLDDAYLTETGYKGKWIFYTGDFSALVSADPGQHTYLPRQGQLDGSDGVWQKAAFEFRTVADLLASKQLGAEGAYWYAAGYRYEQAASGAADHHLTTTSGVKLYALPVDEKIMLGALNVDYTGGTDNTAELIAAGVAARRSSCGIGGGAGTIEFSGDSEIDWSGIDFIDLASFLKRASGSAYFAVGKMSSSTTTKFINISVYDEVDPFGIDDSVSRVLRIVGLKHATLEGTASHVEYYADGSAQGVTDGIDSIGYLEINQRQYQVQLNSQNGGWINQNNIRSMRNFIFKTSNDSDGNYLMNGWTIDGLYEGTNSKIDVDHVRDFSIRARFEGMPDDSITFGSNASHVLVRKTYSNGEIQPWIEPVRDLIAENSGVGNRVIHEAHEGYDHKLLASFNAKQVISDGSGLSCAGKGWMDPNTAYREDGVRFPDDHDEIIGGPWILAKKGDVFYFNADADGDFARPCMEIQKASDGSVPVTDPDVALHGFTKPTIWNYAGSGFLHGNYFTQDIFGSSGWDAYIYNGADGEYYVRPVLRNNNDDGAVTVRSAMIGWAGRAFHSRETEMVPIPASPAFLTTSPATPAPIGTQAHDGTGLVVSSKFEETAIEVAMSSSDTAITYSRHCPTVTTGDLIMIELDDGNRHITTLTTGGAETGVLAAGLPSAAAIGRRVWIGRWV